MSAIASAFLPVILFTVLGWLACVRGWLTPARVKRVSTLVFVVLTPPLLFRTMSTVRLEEITLRPLVAYFGAAAIIFIGTLAASGITRRGAVLALANTFSNSVMIGIPMVGIAFGHAGLVVLLTLISVHALVILTSATLVLEFALLKELGSDSNFHLKPVLLAMRNALLHPVPLPIIAGLAFAQTGVAMPAAIDLVLKGCGLLFAPLALMLVGSSLAATRIGVLWRPALAIAVVKNLVHPLLVAAIGWAIGLEGVPFAVMVLASSLPVGANVFLFSQRYEVARELVTAGVAVSAVLALVSVPAVMALLNV